MNAPNPRILVVEDDPPIRRFLKASLSTQGYDLIEVSQGNEGLASAASFPPDVILLDLGLPDMDGLDFIRSIREWSNVSIIILSARGQERDKIHGLDAGADDYLTKPFSVGELLARIRVMLRRTVSTDQGLADALYAIGDIVVDMEKRRVVRGEEEIHLTPIEYKLLTTLIHHRGKVITHRQLLMEVWGPSHSDQNHYLRIYILQLRRKIESDPNRPQYILTEPGIGYRLKEEL